MRLMRAWHIISSAAAAAVALSGCRSIGTMDPGAQVTPHFQTAGHQPVDATAAQDGTSNTATAGTPSATWDVVFSEQGEEVFFNGSRIPDTNLRREPDAIEVIGHDGSVVKRIALPAPPPTLRPRSFLGAQLRWVSPALASHLGLDPKRSTEVGAILADGPAALAGLHEHDVIIKVDGDDNASPDTIRARLAQDAPGATIAFTLQHGQSQREVVVKLGAWRHQPLPSAPIRSIKE